MSASHHPSALRNREFILKALQSLMSADTEGLALEIASGTGAHIEVIAPAFPKVTFQPSEYVPETGDLEKVGKIGDRSGMPELAALDSCGADQHTNVQPAVAIDASLPYEQWPTTVMGNSGKYALVFCSNVTHITPFAVTKGLLAGASRALAEGAFLVIYGPFKLDGQFTTESNAAFDASLRQRNPAWGYRDVEQIRAEASKVGLILEERREMPANNFLLVLKRQHSTL